ncbi:5'-methylthioadenosine phosphorylase [Candidatus Tenderia electrophaga]|jgi:5'-deoxy-5'-methylthioadenosine phosphorylase|uniref:Probable S-methyl-5'-thioinosine phosphorylase n=1 Tax=Candidatus Tenderia electrophaga TaxID=1748243 RepID=A0A0S2TDM6_9GAMM|nr:5'-methylthioadenosine phosphorylase [Candidatus Tenderia electrophaga]
MSNVAIIGGTGLTRLEQLEITKREVVHTPYGEPSGTITHGTLCGKNVLFLPRHGAGHTIPPHKINYRANIWALNNLGVERIVAIAAVGAIDSAFVPTSLGIPDQIVDYTWSRKNTFFEEGLDEVVHIDFTYPYDAELRRLLIQACTEAKVDFCDAGTYAAAQGPRLETAAEINRYARDGCTMVGMTGMPEAALARELGMAYATCAVSVNWAAGRSEGEITMAEIQKCLGKGMDNVRAMFERLVPLL